MGIVRQEQQTGQLLTQGGLARKVLFGQILKAKLLFRGQLIGHLHVHVQDSFFTQRQDVGWSGFFKAQKHLSQFGFHPFARLQFDLSTGVGFG